MAYRGHFSKAITLLVFKVALDGSHSCLLESFISALVTPWGPLLPSLSCPEAKLMGEHVISLRLIALFHKMGCRNLAPTDHVTRG